jgi:hypothetical protein
MTEMEEIGLLSQKAMPPMRVKEQQKKDRTKAKKTINLKWAQWREQNDMPPDPTKGKKRRVEEKAQAEEKAEVEEDPRYVQKRKGKPICFSTCVCLWLHGSACPGLVTLDLIGGAACKTIVLGCQVSYCESQRKYNQQQKVTNVKNLARSTDYHREHCKAPSQ